MDPVKRIKTKEEKAKYRATELVILEKIEARKRGLRNEKTVLESIKKDKTIEGLCQEMVITDHQIMIAKKEKDLEEIREKIKELINSPKKHN